MTKDLQKSANRLRELKLPHPGILDQALFDKHFSLHCYKPSADLAPFVTHIFTQRVKQPSATYRPLEILSGPNIYLFFTPKRAFVHTITSGIFEYDTKAAVIAGVKFRPGGFKAFFGKPLSQLGQGSQLSEVWPDATEDFCRSLLSEDDEQIKHQIELLLYSKQPVYDKNTETVERVLAILESEQVSSVEDLAQATGKSARSLQLLFQRYVGIGAKWVINRKRLLSAIDYMYSGKPATWSQAAAEAGYSTSSHFSNEFKAVLGISPTDYAKAIRIGR